VTQQPSWYAPEDPNRLRTRVRRSLVAASTVAAGGAWLANGSVWLFAHWPAHVHSVEQALSFLLFGWIVLFLVFLLGIAIAIAGGVATVPLAVAWARTSPRGVGAGVALAHAVLAWAVLAYVLAVVVL
jgi:hypothetical protein